MKNKLKCFPEMLELLTEVQKMEKKILRIKDPFERKNSLAQMRLYVTNKCNKIDKMIEKAKKVIK